MKQPRRRIADLIAQRSLKDGGISPQLSQEVAAYLLSERRVNELDSVLRDVQLAWAADGHVEVLARTAHPLDMAAKAMIKAQVKRLYPQAKQIVVTEIHDPTILGGVQLSVAEQQLDMSVEAKLNKFKQLTVSGKD